MALGFQNFRSRDKCKRPGLRRCLQDAFDTLEPFSLRCTIGNHGLWLDGMHSRDIYVLLSVVQDTDYLDVALGTVQGAYKIDRTRQGQIDHQHVDF